MTIIIPFEEVVRKTKVYRGEEKRVKEKEAIYRGLIGREARRLGIAFEEMKKVTDARAKRVEAETPNLDKMDAYEKGISLYEAKLDNRIEFLSLWEKHFAPHQPIEWELETLDRDL